MQHNSLNFLLNLMAPIINLQPKENPVKTAPRGHLPEHNIEMVDTHVEE